VIISLKFGASHETDAYFIAQSVVLFFAAFGDRVINLTFVPVFVDYAKNKGEEEAWNIANATFTLVCVCLFLICLCIFVFAPTLAKILAPGFSAEALSLTTTLIRVISPIPLLVGLSFVPAAVFYSHRSFIVPSITGLFYAGGAITLALLVADRFGIVSIPFGSAIGMGLQALVLIWLLKRKERMFNLSWDFGHPGVRKARNLAGPRLGGFAVAKVNVMVDRVFASWLGEGYVSCLSYAQRVFEIPSAILATTLGRIFVPVVSEYSASGAKEKIREFVSKAIRAVGFVAIPLAIIFFVFRTPIIGFLFQRGGFDAGDTHLTASAFLFYDVGLVAVSFNFVLMSIFFALQDTVTPLKIGLVCAPLNVILDMILMRLLGLGGIALATSLIAILNTVYLLGQLRKKIGHLDGYNILKPLLRITLASGLMGFVVWSMTNSYNPFPWPDKEILGLGLLFFISLVTYAIACVLLRVDEFRIVLRLLRKGLSL
jgi:putative peptidoglycan lipid II flippase